MFLLDMDGSRIWIKPGDTEELFECRKLCTKYRSWFVFPDSEVQYQTSERKGQPDSKMCKQL